VRFMRRSVTPGGSRDPAISRPAASARSAMSTRCAHRRSSR
jgi:hypothetical protein